MSLNLDLCDTTSTCSVVGLSHCPILCRHCLTRVFDDFEILCPRIYSNHQGMGSTRRPRTTFLQRYYYDYYYCYKNHARKTGIRRRRRSRRVVGGGSSQSPVHSCRSGIFLATCSHVGPVVAGQSPTTRGQRRQQRRQQQQQSR